MNPEEGYEQILNAIGDVVVYIVDRDTHEILFCNDAAKKEDTTLMGKRLYEIWEEQWSAAWKEEKKGEQFLGKTVFFDTARRKFEVTVTAVRWGREDALSIAAVPVIESKG